jgi:hypothetical protein
MSTLMKWKKAIYVVFAVGIFGFATYGICHMAYALNDLRQSQNTGGEVAISCTSSEECTPTPGGTLCNPAGCAGCSGCVNTLYRENIASLPFAAITVEQIY